MSLDSMPVVTDVRGCRAMILVYQPELTHSVWIDYMHRARTYKGLKKKLRSEVKSGTCVAWRIVRVLEEEMGIVS